MTEKLETKSSIKIILPRELGSAALRPGDYLGNARVAGSINDYDPYHDRQPTVNTLDPAAGINLKGAQIPIHKAIQLKQTAKDPLHHA